MWLAFWLYWTVLVLMLHVQKVSTESENCGSCDPKPQAPEQPTSNRPMAFHFLTRMEHSVVWKTVISSAVLLSLRPQLLSRAFQPQKCTH